MTVGKRLKKIIDTCFETQNNLSKLSGIDKISLSRYIHDQVTPSSDGLIKLLEIGISSDWILSGVGSMFADNLSGHKLKETFYTESETDFQTPISRIKYWIESNYYSLKHFCLALDFNYNKILEIFEDNHILDPDFLILLKKAGCNLNWIVSGLGEHYTNCPIGSFLKLQQGKRNGINHEELTFDNINNDPFFTEEQIKQISSLPRILTVLKGVEYEKNITK